MSLDPLEQLRRTEGIVTVPIREELAVWHPGSDLLLLLDGPAALVWSSLDQPRTATDIATRLAMSTGLGPAHMLRDVSATCQVLLDAGVICGDTARVSKPPPVTEPVPAAGWTVQHEVVHATAPIGVSSEQPLPKSLGHHLEAMGTTFSLEWEAEWLDDVLPNAFPGLSRRAAAGPADIKYRLQRVDQHALALFRNEDFLDRIPDRYTLLRWLTNDITKQCYLRTQDLVLHAAAVRGPNGAVVIVGESGSGKSTLAAALVASLGWDYLADEAVRFNGSTCAVWPFRRPIKLRPDGAKAFQSIASGVVPVLDDWSLIEAGGTSPGPVPASALILVRYEPGATATMVPLSAGASLHRLLVSCLAPARDFPKRLHLVAHIVETVECYEFVYGNLEKAIQTVGALRAPTV